MREGRRTIPPLSRLPEPDEAGTHDDWTSRIWRRGDKGLRIRTKQEFAVMNEFVKSGDDVVSVRKITGSHEWIATMAEAWFKRL